MSNLPTAEKDSWNALDFLDHSTMLISSEVFFMSHLDSWQQNIVDYGLLRRLVHATFSSLWLYAIQCILMLSNCAIHLRFFAGMLWMLCLILLCRPLPLFLMTAITWVHDHRILWIMGCLQDYCRHCIALAALYIQSNSIYCTAAVQYI